MNQWVISQNPTFPHEMHRASTFYEAARAADGSEWAQQPDKGRAMTMWVTIRLVAGERTRPYVAKLIPGDNNGRTWLSAISGATCRAMDALSPDSARLSSRSFEQKRSTAIKSLKKSLEALSCLPVDLSLRKHLSDPSYELFLENVRDFEFEELLRSATEQGSDPEQFTKIGAAEWSPLRLTHSPKNKVPDVRALLHSALEEATSLPKQVSDRHQARAHFIRAMYSGLSGTVVTQRIAFIAHSVEAVFGERIEKRDVRETVSDLALQEKDFAEEMEKLKKYVLESKKYATLAERWRSLYSNKPLP